MCTFWILCLLFHHLDFRSIAKVTLSRRGTREFPSILDIYFSINLEYSHLHFSKSHTVIFNVVNAR